MRKLILAGSLILTLAVAGIAAADGPVLWKMDCPRHHQIQTIEQADGVTVLCVRLAESDR